MIDLQASQRGCLSNPLQGQTGCSVLRVKFTPCGRSPNWRRRMLLIRIMGIGLIGVILERRVRAKTMVGTGYAGLGEEWI